MIVRITTCIPPFSLHPFLLAISFICGGGGMFDVQNKKKGANTFAEPDKHKDPGNLE
jgi:hypothetical protein